MGVSPAGVEYAIVEVYSGLSIVSLEHPEEPIEVQFVPRASVSQSGLVTFREHAYIVNEAGNGLQVLDLSNLPDNIEYADWELNIATEGDLSDCFEIFIDEIWVYISCRLQD